MTSATKTGQFTADDGVEAGKGQLIWKPRESGRREISSPYGVAGVS